MTRKRLREEEIRGLRALIAALFLTTLPGLCLAGDITFSSSGSIGPNDTYDTVYVQNDGTIVDMWGGQIARLRTSYISTFNFHAGQIIRTDPLAQGPDIDIGPLGTLNIFDGLVSIGTFILGGESYTLLSGGNISIFL